MKKKSLKNKIRNVKAKRFVSAPRAMKLHVKKGDTVVVLSGKDKGKKGEVLRALPKAGRVVVDGVAIVKRSLKRTSRGQSGRIVERPASIDASNVRKVEGAKAPAKKEKKESK